MKQVALLACVVVLWTAGPANGEDAKLSRPAAKVNGQVIPESAVERVLRRVSPEDRDKARKDILDFLIDLTLVDQYVIQQGFTVSEEELQARLKEVKEELGKTGRDYATILKSLMISEEEFKQQLLATIRWEKFLESKATDKQLIEFFVVRKDWFDGSKVRARHVLIAVPEDADAKTRQAAQAKITALKKQIEGRIAERSAKLDPKLDPLRRAEAQLEIAEEVFAEAARDSDCPSKKNGGELGWFPRRGVMAEPFAQAAFALKPGEMAGPVETQFGYHLILCTGREPGKEVKFEEIKPFVRLAYSDWLRLDLLPHLRKAARIEIMPPSP
jgi:parvulin-like peptidyl-prolyl isomerase